MRPSLSFLSFPMFTVRAKKLNVALEFVSNASFPPFPLPFQSSTRAKKIERGLRTRLKFIPPSTPLPVCKLRAKQLHVAL